MCIKLARTALDSNTRAKSRSDSALTGFGVAALDRRLDELADLGHHRGELVVGVLLEHRRAPRAQARLGGSPRALQLGASPARLS